MKNLLEIFVGSLMIIFCNSYISAIDLINVRMLLI